jgi:hypothetical protein
MGMIIDTHQIVVRLKGCRTVLGTDDYGSRVDHLCASTEIMGTFFRRSSRFFLGLPQERRLRL